MSKHKQEIFKALSVLSLLKNDTSSKERLQIYCALLDKYPIQSIKFAISKLAVESRFFPDVSEIIKIINPPVDADQVSIEIADRIISAISDFGWCNPSKARDYIGDIGWEVVQRMGGWVNISKIEISHVNMLRSQIRISAKAAVNSGEVKEIQGLILKQIEGK